MCPALVYTHDDLARWRDCPRRFWLHLHSPTAGHMPLPPQADSWLEHNPLADQALRTSFPLAQVIDTPHDDESWRQSIARTHEVLAAGWLASHAAEGQPDEGRAILGACLESNEGIRVRMDVLTTGPYGLRLFKVRFATVGDENDVDQVALWTHVAARNGLRVQSAGLLLVDSDFVYPGMGCYGGIFRETELMPVLGSRSVPDWLIAMRRCERELFPAAADDAPCHTPRACRFTDMCGTTERARCPPEPADLNIVGRELATELRAIGHTSALTVPLDELPDNRRRRAVSAVQQGHAILEPEVAAIMAALPYPRHFLRIDTIGFAVPIWVGTHPYQVMPFQWSCDVLHSPGQLEHHAFLATAEGDPRRAFTTSLLNLLGTQGAILAYNAGFERNRLRELSEAFEDLAPQLTALQARIVDLYQVARANYYHPDMCGSWSFKSLVRAMAPHTQADHFEWRGLEEAQEAFGVSLQGRLSRDDLDELRKALLAYGQRQAGALRHIVDCFEQAALARPLPTPSQKA